MLLPEIYSITLSIETGVAFMHYRLLFGDKCIVLSNCVQNSPHAILRIIVMISLTVDWEITVSRNLFCALSFGFQA